MCIDEWITCDFTFFQIVFLSNSISVISGGWVDDNESLCAMKLCLQMKNSPPHMQGLNPGPLDQQASA